MYLKKLVIGALSAVMITTLMNPNIVSAENVKVDNESYDIMNSAVSLDKTGKELLPVPEEKTKADGHHSADTALFLDESYMGQVLMDGATSEENWYYFYADAGCKLTALLEQPADGDYDIVLYKLDLDTGNLTAAASSGYGGNVIDRLSAVNNSAGYYFLQVLPSTASVADDASYYFIINSVTAYDKNEPNDNVSQCNVNTDKNISLSGTIDNVFDQDWTKVTLQGTKNYQLNFDNIPSGAQYAAVIYDGNLNVKASIISEGSSKSYVSLGAGNYYICFGSYNNQYSPTATYTFKMNEVHSLDSTFYKTKGGHQVEVTPSAVYINGSPVNFNWEFEYNINYIRSQKFRVTDSTAIYPNSYQNGTFIDGQNMNASSDCVRVRINNFSMSYYCNSPYASWTKNFDANAWTYFYIDANTGKTIGTDANYYHTNMGITNRFSRF